MASKTFRFFLRLTPLHRTLLSMAFAALSYFFTPKNFPPILHFLWLWSAFAICYLVCCWLIIEKTNSVEIKKKAQIEDGSKLYVYTMIVAASIGCLFAVLLLLTNDYDLKHIAQYVKVIIALIGMLSSWLLVHTIYIFHYAHSYYNNPTNLDFQGTTHPTYIDFAYFSFGIGCTFQVSDIAIKNSALRKKVLFHSLLSFFINSFMVALTVNIVAGLSSH